MHNLREHLLKAGLVTAEQVARAETKKSGKKKKRRPQNKKDQPTHRMVDLSDPKRLEIQKAIEVHKLRGEVRGDHIFNFVLRDGRVRKMFVTDEIRAGLEAGRYGIVENGSEDAHVLVAADAVPAIHTVDPDAVRFHNKN